MTVDSGLQRGIELQRGVELRRITPTRLHMGKAATSRTSPAISLVGLGPRVRGRPEFHALCARQDLLGVKSINTAMDVAAEVSRAACARCFLMGLSAPPGWGLEERPISGHSLRRSDRRLDQAGVDPLIKTYWTSTKATTTSSTSGRRSSRRR